MRSCRQTTWLKVESRLSGHVNYGLFPASRSRPVSSASFCSSGAHCYNQHYSSKAKESLCWVGGVSSAAGEMEGKRTEARTSHASGNLSHEENFERLEPEGQAGEAGGDLRVFARPPVTAEVLSPLSPMSSTTGQAALRLLGNLHPGPTSG